jgi:hypothetical protein
MLKPYLVVFDASQIVRQSLLDHLDTRPEVKNWFAFLPTAVFVISDHTARQLTEAIRIAFPAASLMVTEVPAGANDGWLGKNVWDFINSPQSSGRWPV